MNTLRTLPALNSRRAFSLPELVATVTVLAIITTVSVVTVTKTRTGVTATKLQSDVQTLNQVVSVYLASGGSLAGVTDPQEVLDRLKSVISADDRKRNVGVMTGRGIDARLAVKRQTSQEASSSSARAYWDSTAQKFVVSTKGGSGGIAGFDLDNSLAGTVAAIEKRKQSGVLYNGSAGWVWATADPVSQANLAPTGAAVSDAENHFNPTAPPAAGSGSGSSSSTGSTGGTSSTGSSSTGSTTGSTTTGGSTATTGSTGTTGTVANGTSILPSPIISPPGGAFFAPLFPKAVYLNPNGAPLGSSMMQYRLNNGPWIVYTGPFTVTTGTKVTAVNLSTNAGLFFDSAPVTESYFLLVTAFSGTTVAKWNPSGGPSGLKSTINNSNADEVIERDGTATSSTPGQNVFTFQRQAAFSNVSPNSPFSLGKITYHNGTIQSGTGSTTLNLHLDIALKDPSVASTGADIKMTLENTPNSSGGSNAKSADACTLANPVTNYSIVVNGVTYTLVIKYGDIDISKGYISGNTLNVWEGADGDVEILGTFASSTP